MSDMTPPQQPIDWNLRGKRIAVPEMRELEVFSGLLERRGAEVLRCPLVTIYDTPHSAQVLAFAVRVAEGGFDDFVLITGEGLTRIVSCFNKYDPALQERFIAGLAKMRTITRGPKPARVLAAEHLVLALLGHGDARALEVPVVRLLWRGHGGHRARV